MKVGIVSCWFDAMKVSVFFLLFFFFSFSSFISVATAVVDAFNSNEFDELEAIIAHNLEFWFVILEIEYRLQLTTVQAVKRILKPVYSKFGFSFN